MLAQAILEAVKSRMQAEIADVRQENIYITSDENYIPDAVSPPCIGIRENGVSWSYVPNDRGGRMRGEYSLMIVVYSDLIRDEMAVTGDESINEKGVLETCKNVVSALDGYCPVDGCIDSVITNITPAESFDDGTNIRLCRQKVMQEITALETRPSKRLK